MGKSSGHGIQLQISDGAASPTYTEIAQVESIQPPGWQRGSEDVPTHDDTGGIDVLVDALYKLKPFTITVLYDPAGTTHADLDDKKSSMDSDDYRVVYPDTASTQVDFAAFVTDFQPQDIPANTGKLRADVEFTPTGDYTRT